MGVCWNGNATSLLGAQRRTWGAILLKRLMDSDAPPCESVRPGAISKAPSRLKEGHL